MYELRIYQTRHLNKIITADRTVTVHHVHTIYIDEQSDVNPTEASFIYKIVNGLRYTAFINVSNSSNEDGYALEVSVVGMTIKHMDPDDEEMFLDDDAAFTVGVNEFKLLGSRFGCLQMVSLHEIKEV